MTESLVCLTSNFGVYLLKNLITPLDMELARRDVRDQMDARFSPAFCDRVREFISFGQLDLPSRQLVAKSMLDQEIALQRANMGSPIFFGQDVVSYVARIGFRGGDGARYMRSTVQTQIREALRLVPIPCPERIVLTPRNNSIVIV